MMMLMVGSILLTGGMLVLGSWLFGPSREEQELRGAACHVGLEQIHTHAVERGITMDRLACAACGGELGLLQAARRFRRGGRD